MDYKSIWHKTKFGTKLVANILATNFGNRQTNRLCMGYQN